MQNSDMPTVLHESCQTDYHSCTDRATSLSGLGTSVLKMKPQLMCLWQESNWQYTGFDPIETPILGVYDC